MQAIGHQVVGCKDSSHEEVKLMYERFFGGQAANVKKVLKKEFGPIKTKFMLSRIFQVILKCIGLHSAMTSEKDLTVL